MHIVFIAHFAGSPLHGMVYGHYYLAREWVRMGHKVTVVAASVAHTRFKQPECRSRLFSEEYIDGIRYLWVASHNYSPSDKIGRIINIVSFTLRTWVHRLPIEKADVVICSSHYPFAIFPARKLAKQKSAKLILEIRDLWPLTLIELGGASPWNPFIMLMQWAENFAYKRAEKIVSVLPGAKQYMISHGMAEDKFVYIPNGVDIDTQEKEPLSESVSQQLEHLKHKGAFLIGYAGRIGLANALHPLIEALCNIDNEYIHIVLLGDGSHKTELQQKCIQAGVQDQVIFLPSVPKKQVSSFLSVMDILFIGLQAQPLFRLGVSPTKLNDYLLAGKPIICAIDSIIEAIEESGAGIKCRAENSQDISDAVEKLYSKSPQEREEMGERGRKWVIACRDYRVLAKRFLASIGV